MFFQTLAVVGLMAVQHVSARALSKVSATTDAGRTVPTPFITYVSYGDTKARCEDKASAQEVGILNTECVELQGKYLSVKGHSDNPGVTYNSLHIYNTNDCSNGWTLEPLDSNHCSDIAGFHSIRFVPNGVEVPGNASPPALPTNWPWESEVPKPFTPRNSQKGECSEWCVIGRVVICCEEISSGVTGRDESHTGIDHHVLGECKNVCYIDSDNVFCCEGVSYGVTGRDEPNTGSQGSELGKCKKGFCHVGENVFCCEDISMAVTRRDESNTGVDGEVPGKCKRLCYVGHNVFCCDRVAPTVIRRDELYAGIDDSLLGRCKKDWCNIGRYRFCCDPKNSDSSKEAAANLRSDVSPIITFSGEQPTTGIEAEPMGKCTNGWCNIGRYRFCCSLQEASELDPITIKKDILSLAGLPAKLSRDTTPIVQVLDKDAFTALTDSPEGKCKKNWCNIGRYRFCCDPKDEKDLNPAEIAREISTAAKATRRYDDETADIANITANFAYTDDVQKCKKWCWIGRHLFCCKKV